MKKAELLNKIKQVLQGADMTEATVTTGTDGKFHWIQIQRPNLKDMTIKNLSAKAADLIVKMYTTKNK
ncbi:MAG: hypothetical protein Q8S18_00040 [Bacteroidales bacterium]|nr:hypothetical protein [Bacteroidales bacterium]